MVSGPTRRLRHVVLGGSFALVAMLCAWPSRADAGCSHYVVAKSGLGAPAHQLVLLEDLGEVDSSSEAPARPKPCSGAFCTGKPGIPVPVSITTIRTVDAVAARRLASPDPRAKGRLLACAGRCARPVIEGPSIHRPPR